MFSRAERPWSEGTLPRDPPDGGACAPLRHSNMREADTNFYLVRLLWLGVRAREVRLVGRPPRSTGGPSAPKRATYISILVMGLPKCWRFNTVSVVFVATFPPNPVYLTTPSPLADDHSVDFRYFYDRWNFLDVTTVLFVSISFTFRMMELKSGDSLHFFLAQFFLAASAPLLFSRVLFLAQIGRALGPMTQVILPRLGQRHGGRVIWMLNGNVDFNIIDATQTPCCKCSGFVPSRVEQLL